MHNIFTIIFIIFAVLPFNFVISWQVVRILKRTYFDLLGNIEKQDNRKCSFINKTFNSFLYESFCVPCMTVMLSDTINNSRIEEKNIFISKRNF